MSETTIKHTPGPWMVLEAEYNNPKAMAYGIASYDQPICRIPVIQGYDNTGYNAKLICNAPDLHIKLRDLVEGFENLLPELTASTDVEENHQKLLYLQECKGLSQAQVNLAKEIIKRVNE